MPEELGHLHFHTGALEDPFSLVRLLQESNPDEIYHLAGISDSRQSFIVPEQTIESITVGTLRVLEAGRQFNSAIRYFLASSSEIFGVPLESPQHEGTARRPATPYGIAKQAADSLAALYREKYNQFISVGILFNHESPLRPANYLSRRVAQSVAAIKTGKQEKLVLGDLTAERDWSDARDFVQGFWLSLQGAASGEYVFSSGIKRTVKEFVDCAFKAAGLNAAEHVESRAETVPTQVRAGLCGDSSKAVKQLGWVRRWDFSSMVSDMVQAELEQRPEVRRAAP